MSSIGGASEVMPRSGGDLDGCPWKRCVDIAQVVPSNAPKVITLIGAEHDYSIHGRSACDKKILTEPGQHTIKLCPDLDRKRSTRPQVACRIRNNHARIVGWTADDMASMPRIGR